MATQKRLNKNLVAFLTIMAMVLVVSVIALVARQQARRDPEILAQSARDSRQAGDLEEAWRRFLRAWDASELRGEPNTKYVLEAAECAYEMGELGNWRGLLERISAKLPHDQALVVALLEGLWRTLHISGVVHWPDVWRDAGEKLLQLDESNLLAMVSVARGLWELRGVENEARADRLAAQAFELAPRDPRVAATYVVHLQREARKKLDAALQAGGRPSDIDRVNREFTRDVLTVMEPAMEEHPGDVALASMFADFLAYEGRRLDQAQDAAGATELFARARDALRRAIEARADQPSADLYLALAQHERAAFERAHPGTTAADMGPLRAEIERIDGHAQRAIEFDAAMYEAYTLRADLVQRFAVGPDGAELPLVERLEKALALLESAKERTLTLRSLRALLRPFDRLLMLRGAFDVAMLYEIQAAAGEGGKTPTYARAEALLDEVRSRYPEYPLTFYMQGQLHVVRGDAVAAIGALQQAYQKAEQAVGARAQAEFWFARARVTRLPSEQLALLYLQRSQYGEAARWAELAMREFRDAGVVPPAVLVAGYGEILRQVGRPEDGLGVVNEFRARYPDDQAIAAVRVALLTDLNRSDEAKAGLEQLTGSGPSMNLWRAQKAAEQGDYATAEDTLRAVMKDDGASDEHFREALQRLIGVLDRTRRRPEARALVQELKSDPPRGGLQRMLERLELELAVDDPTRLTAEELKELDAKRKELIAQTPNALFRAQEYYQFHASRGDWEQALPYLEELRKELPAEMRLVAEEFQVRLYLRQFERVTDLLAMLSQYDGGKGFDYAGGAIYRGDLAIAKGDTTLAITEYRQAAQQLPAKSDELEVKLARAYLVAGRISEGLEALNRAVATNPRNFDAHWLLREVHRQRAGQSFGAEKAESEALAEKAQARAAELNPDHPEVRAWAQEAAEERDPLAAIAERERKRAADPNDEENLVRLSDLLVRAWRQAAGGTDEALRQEILAAADRLFPETLFAVSGDAQMRLARDAAELYSLAQRAEQGAGLLRRLLEQRTGESRVEAQMLIAMFFEALGNPDAAEREYQNAQRLIREATQDVEAWRRLELNVGTGLIRFHQRQRRADKVAEACRWLLDRLGSEPSQAATSQQVRLMLIEALYSAGQLGDAEAEIQGYLKAYPGDLAGLSARAQLHLRKKERDLALEDLTRVLERDPENVPALYSRGRLALERGQYDRARADLLKAEEVIGREPRLEADLRRQLASLYMRTRQFDLAVSELRILLDLLEAEGGRGEQRQQVVRQLARLLYSGLDQFERAQRLISEYMEKHPTEALWPFELGRLFEVQGSSAEQEAQKARQRGDSAKERERLDAARQSYSSAVTYYQRAAERAGERNPLERTGALIARLGALNRAGRGAEVLDTFRKTDFAMMPEPGRVEARARMGVEAAKAHHAAGAAEAAAERWQQALCDACTQNIGLAGDVAAELRDTLGDRAGAAEQLLRQTLEGRPADDQVGRCLRILLGTHLCLTGNAAGALPVLSEALATTTKGTPEQLSALLTRAQAQDWTGDREGAIRTYKEVLADYPDNLTALNNLAYTLVEAPPPLYAPAEARKYAERLRSLLVVSENVGTMLDTVGWVHFHNNELDLAVSALEEAFSASGSDTAVCLHLGQVYRKLNRIADARSVLTQGLELARLSGNAESVRQFEDALDSLK